jgi:citrate lyase subunit beta/citryl-CoA lyase
MTAPITLSRSTLIVPLSNETFIAHAHLRGADTILLDLEDGVAPSAKEAARKRLPSAAASVSQAGAHVNVRVNRPLGLMVRDLEAAVIPGISTISLAKVEGPGHVRLVSEFIGELEQQRGLPPGGIRLSATIETPQALLQAADIARADPRLSAIGLGGLDLAAACGFEPTPDVLLGPMQTLLFAAKAAGISAGGYLGSIADYRDLEGMRRLLRRSRSLGFHGGAAIHPSQVAVLNEEFAPTAQEIDDARAIVALAADHFAKGTGAFSYRGRMIDKPVVIAAETTLALADAIAESEVRTRRLLDAAA